MDLDFSRVTRLKQLLDQQRPLTKGEAQRIAQEERVRMVYHSNALEGNSLTAFETKMVLQKGITVGKKPLADYLEAVDLNEAMDYVEELVAQETPLTESDLKRIHYLVFKSTSKEDAGRYRRLGIEITGSRHQPPEPYLIEPKMAELFTWFKENERLLHPIEVAAVFHHRLTSIHPFINGNGRTARLAMNFILMRHGYPPIIVKATGESETTYYQALEHGDVTGDLKPFVRFVNQLSEETLGTYLERLQVPYKEILSSEGQKKMNDVTNDVADAKENEENQGEEPSE